MAKALAELLEEGVAGRHVLVRSDLNVPLKDGVVTDDGPVQVATDLVGEDAKAKSAALKDGEVLVLENVRYDARETSKDDAERGAFADELVALTGQNGAYVDDAFGAVHRKHASVYDVAKGYKVGKSLLEKDQVETVRRYLETAPAQGTEIITAVDVVWADDFSADAKTEIRPIEDLEGGELGAEGEGLDIGPKSRELFAEKIKAAKTVFWNGPVGVFEIAPFAGGTEAVAKALAESDAFSIIGGGDSASAIRNLGFADEQFGHISTGGGASLEYIEGKTLPGLDALGA